MRITWDLVVNHTVEHPWFVESASAPHSLAATGNYWRPRASGTEPAAPSAEPTNWESLRGGP